MDRRAITVRASHPKTRLPFMDSSSASPSTHEVGMKGASGEALAAPTNVLVIASGKHGRCDRSPRRILLDGYRQPRLQWELAVAVMTEVVDGHDLRKTSRGLSMPTSAWTRVTYVHEIVNFEYRRQLPLLGSVFFELIVTFSTVISPETLVLSSN